MSEKMTKKELKEPDFLQVEMSKMMVYIDRHRSRLISLLAIVLIGLSVYGGWSFYQFNCEKTALKYYNQVEAEFTKGAGVASDKLLAGYKNVTVKYPNTQAGLYAYYQLGNLHLNLRQYDKSLQAYANFLDQADSRNLLKVFAYSGQGYCYEEMKNFPKALEQFELALKMPEGKELAAQIYRDKARIYGKMNDIKKSKEYYGKAIEITKDRNVMALLKRKLADLN